MSHRTHKLTERTQAARHLLGWFSVVAATTVVAAFTVTCSAQAAEPAEPGLMLRPGLWTQDDSSYALPPALDKDPREWPVDGWYRITHKGSALDVRAVDAPARGMPTFLRDIAVQLVDPAGGPVGSAESEAEAVDTRYVRVPAVRFAEGRLPAVVFARGALTPRLDHAYQLALGSVPFTLTVQNGLRSKAGVAYGGGAVYLVNTDSGSYSFHIDTAAGWETRIAAVADLDSDGKPDFIVQAGGQEVLLLSSQARPGLTPPAAVLAVHEGGC